MDEKENLEQEFTLEDILREFGSEPVPEEIPSPELEDEAVEEMPVLDDAFWAVLNEIDAPDPEEGEEPVEPGEPEADEDADVREYIPAGKEPQEAQAATDETTRRFPPVSGEEEAAQTGSTIRFEPLKEREKPQPTAEGTIRFSPVEPEETVSPEETTAEPLPEGAEPLSDVWPEQTDAPTEEYIPPEPIVFRPRSRLHDLKRKLIAGPERRYYALSEMGLGKLQAGIFLSVLVVILAFVALGLHSAGLVRENRMRLLVFGELFAMLLSALLASNRLVDGLAGLFRLKFTPDTLLVLAFGVCIADGIVCLQQVRVPFCAAFCLMVSCSLWAEYQRRNVEMGQMDTMRKAVRLNRVAKGPECYDGRPGFFVSDGEVEDFMDTYAQRTGPERAISIYCLTAFLASILVAAAATVTKGLHVGLQTWSAALLAATPMTLFICQSRPMAVLERRLHRVGVVLCGWQGIKELSGPAVVPLTDTDLLPAGSVKINGVKFYSRRDPDQVIGYAAAVMDCTDNALAPLFRHLQDSRNARRYEARAYRAYENGGMGAIVNEESVLLGTVSFLQDMGVEIPEGTKVNQAVYAAVEGELCGVFALAYGKLKGVSAGLGALCGSRSLTPVIVSDNFLLSDGFIRSRYSVNTRRIAFPTGQARQELERWQPQAGVPCALTTQEGLASTAYAITGGRALRSACNLGALVHILAGLLGLVMVLLLTLVGADSLLTPLNLMLLHLVWALPALLISGWTRHL